MSGTGCDCHEIQTSLKLLKRDVEAALTVSEMTPSTEQPWRCFSKAWRLDSTSSAQVNDLASVSMSVALAMATTTEAKNQETWRLARSSEPDSVQDCWGQLKATATKREEGLSLVTPLEPNSAHDWEKWCLSERLLA